MTKKAAQRIANAICELDSASWNIRGAMSEPCERLPERLALEHYRKGLFALLNSLGYEFASCDSRRIRKLVKIETAASILAEMNRSQQAANLYTNITAADVRRKAMSKRL